MTKDPKIQKEMLENLLFVQFFRYFYLHENRAHSINKVLFTDKESFPTNINITIFAKIGAVIYNVVFYYYILQKLCFSKHRPYLQRYLYEFLIVFIFKIAYIHIMSHKDSILHTMDYIFHFLCVFLLYLHAHFVTSMNC